MHTIATDRQSTPDSQPKPHEACRSGCCGCKAFAAFDPTVPPSHYVLGAIWVFLVPMLGLIVGCALAAGWDGHPLRQAISIVAGLTIGVAIGVVCRRVTLPTGEVRPQGTQRGRA